MNKIVTLSKTAQSYDIPMLVTLILILLNWHVHIFELINDPVFNMLRGSFHYKIAFQVILKIWKISNMHFWKFNSGYRVQVLLRWHHCGIIYKLLIWQHCCWKHPIRNIRNSVLYDFYRHKECHSLWDPFCISWQVF